MILYLDTSALVKLYVNEDHSDAVRQAQEEAATVATATVAYAEARAALARLRREKILRPKSYFKVVSQLDQDWEAYLRIGVGNALARAAGLLAERYALRGYDAVHLAAALQLQAAGEDVRLLAFDSRLVEAARQVIYRS